MVERDNKDSTREWKNQQQNVARRTTDFKQYFKLRSEEEDAIKALSATTRIAITPYLLNLKKILI